MGLSRTAQDRIGKAKQVWQSKIGQGRVEKEKEIRD